MKRSSIPHASTLRAIPAIALLAMASLAYAGPPTPCAPIANAAPLLHPGALVLLGEMHGSQESPRFAADLVCNAAAHGVAILGMEIPRDEQSRIDAYLASKGGADERARVIAGTFWTRPTGSQDGRSSAAMFDLIERMRDLRAHGRDVRIVTLDRAASDPTDRDEVMAARLREAKAATPKAIVIALTGNIHNSLAPDGAQAPMGARLRNLDPTALTASYADGSIWACMPDCAIHAVEGSKKAAAAWSIELDPFAMGERRWSGVFRLGALHASPPAVSDAHVPAPRSGT